jgi:hypothetical protein
VAVEELAHGAYPPVLGEPLVEAVALDRVDQPHAPSWASACEARRMYARSAAIQPMPQSCR